MIITCSTSTEHMPAVLAQHTSAHLHSLCPCCTQSSFFYGFLLMQLPGGILSSRFGGAFVLPRGIALWSAATAAIPFVVGSMPALCVTRSVMGMGEATAPSSIVDMITRVVPPAKRASSVSFAYGGLHVGTLVRAEPMAGAKGYVQHLHCKRLCRTAKQ
jgi:MFS family permease